MEAVSEIAAAEPGVSFALQGPELGLCRQRIGIEQRMVVLEARERVGGPRCRGWIERDKNILGAIQSLEAVHPVTDFRKVRPGFVVRCAGACSIVPTGPDGTPPGHL